MWRGASSRRRRGAEGDGGSGESPGPACRVEYVARPDTGCGPWSGSAGGASFGGLDRLRGALSQGGDTGGRGAASAGGTAHGDGSSQSFGDGRRCAHADGQLSGGREKLARRDDDARAGGGCGRRELEGGGRPGGGVSALCRTAGGMGTTARGGGVRR